MRRVFDVVGATVMLVLLAPVLSAGVLVVLVSSGRPVFFAHPRLGKGGRPFKCWKLRTMTVGAERWLDLDPELRERHRASGYKLPNGSDPRVTRWGRWLRKTYIDEIPQLLNVLAGDMSLVGPRPIVRSELDLFGEDAADLLQVRPGIFGAWTSLGRNRPPYPARARLELDYVRTRSPSVDLRILTRSVWAVLQGQADE